MDGCHSAALLEHKRATADAMHEVRGCHARGGVRHEGYLTVLQVRENLMETRRFSEKCAEGLVNERQDRCGELQATG